MQQTALRLPADVRLKYRPQGPTLLDFHNSAAFVRYLIGPLGSGKTQACIADVLMRIDTQAAGKNAGPYYGVRASRWVVARNTYRDLLTTTIKDWRAFTDSLRIGEFKNGSGGAPPCWKCRYIKPDGTVVIAEVLFEAFDGPQDERKSRGKQLTGVWFNELKELNKTNSDMLQSRVTRYPPRAEVPNARYHIIGDSNAPDRDHWLAELALDLKPDGWWFGIQPGGVIKVGGRWVNNPKAENRQNLAPTYYVDQLPGKKESWIRKNLANEFVFHTDGRPVHPGFNESVHVLPAAPTPGLPLDVGVDFGRTPAATVMQRQHDGTWRVLRELVTVNTNAKTFGELLSDMLSHEYPGYITRVTGDPAGADMAQTRDETCIDMLNLSGLNASGAPTNDFEMRTTALDTLLDKMLRGEPAIIIDPSCTVLIRGLAGAYCFRRIQVVGDERYQDKPDKGPESHVVESLHYGLLGAGVGLDLFVPQRSTRSATLNPSYFE